MVAPHAGRIGQRVGPYKLERMLGRGGMSVVFFARHEGTGKPAAVKILQAGLPENIVAGRRLEQEARTIARIDHAHVVDMFDSGRTHDGLPWFAMEFLEGESLARVFTRHGRLPVRRMLDIARQMLAGLSAAHVLDVVHRDLKPDNVFLVKRDDGSDFVKMLDFGIAKLLGSHPHAVQSVRGVVLGTPEYLSPEVAMDVDVSPASDIYSLGVILFEGLTGRLPFTGATPTRIAEQHCFDDPPTPRSIAPDLPVPLERVILRCLAKDPEQRYRDAEALDAALRRLDEPDPPAGRSAERQITDELPRISALDPLDAFEDALRLHDVPPTVERLQTLDRLRQKLETLTAEREEIERQVDQTDDALERQEKALLDALAERDELDGELRRLREILRTEHRPAEGDDDAVALVARIDPDGRTIEDGIVDRLRRLARRADQLEQREELRGAMALRIEDAVARQARLDARCARLEADLLLARAVESARQSRLACRLEGLTIEAEIVRQRRARLLAALRLGRR